MPIKETERNSWEYKNEINETKYRRIKIGFYEYFDDVSI